MKVVETAVARHAQCIGNAVENDFGHVVTLGLEVLESLIVLLKDRRKAPPTLHLSEDGVRALDIYWMDEGAVAYFQTSHQSRPPCVSVW